MYCSVIVVNTVFEVKCQNSLTPLLAAYFKALVTVLNDPNVSLMQSMVSTLHSRAFCGAGFYLAKRVFPGFGSCNGHVTAITYGAELNVGGKSRTLGSVCLRILLLFCC